MREARADIRFIEIRIKRFRTKERLSLWECLEKWAIQDGRTMPGAIEHLLNNSPIFRQFLVEMRNPTRSKS